MRIEASMGASVGEGAVAAAQGAMREGFNAALVDLCQRFFIISATNRLRYADYVDNAIFGRITDLAVWELTDSALVMALDVAAEDELDARASLHWLKISWASCWFNHSHVQEFARPVDGLDLTMDIDPVATLDAPQVLPLVPVGKRLVGVRADGELVTAASVAMPKISAKVQTHIDDVQASRRCACKLCEYYRPRAAKWALKRNGIAELCRRIGVGDPVEVKALAPYVGMDRMRTTQGLGPKKKAWPQQVSADEAKRLLQLNPNRGW